MSLNKINLGVAGDPQTGDNIYDGGKKLNNMLEEIFVRSAPSDGDYRMTGYWIPDESNLVDLSSSIPPGLRVDVNTELNTKTVVLDHNEIAYARGDQLQFRDERGTWDTNPCSFDVVSGTIDGVSDPILVRSQNAVVTLTCVDPGNNEWIMRTDSLRGRFDNPLNDEASVTPSSDYDAVIYDTANVLSAKLQLTAVLDSDPSVRTISEVLVSDDGATVFSTEYAVINTTGTAIFDISFQYIADQVVAVVSTSEPSITFRIKTVEYTER